MFGKLKTNKKVIYSDWTLMQCHQLNPNETSDNSSTEKMMLNFADKNSQDAIRLELDMEEIERVYKICKQMMDKQT